MSRAFYTEFVELCRTLGREMIALDKAATAGGKPKTRSTAEPLVPPELYFKCGEQWEGKFAQWDELGVPTHTTDGEPITKSMKKKVDKVGTYHRTVDFYLL